MTIPPPKTRAELEIHGRVIRSGVPARHLSTATDPETPNGRIAAKLAGKLGSGFTALVVGPRGTGKTQLAVELIRAAARRNTHADPRYIRAMSLFIARRDAMRTGASEMALIREHEAASLLVIDECHDRGETRFEDVLLHQLVIGRHDGMRDTVLVGNGTAEDMLASLGDSIASRLSESVGVIVCDWPSFRAKGNA